MQRLSPQLCMKKVGGVSQEDLTDFPTNISAKVEETVETEVENEENNGRLEEITEKPTIDSDLVKSFKGDKDKLEDYGKTFGIDLKKSRSFKNMLKDLENFVEGS